MAPTYVLLTSPLLGPSVWAPVAEVLSGRGFDVVVPRLGEVASPVDVLRGYLAGIPEDRPLTLVAHSNAGLYVAALAPERPVEEVVFVDAGLPEDTPWTPTAPEQFRTFVSGLADADGLLPPWTEWWPSEDTAVLLPDGTVRAAVEREQRRLPLAYFEAAVPSPPGWRDLPAAYLAFGEAYAEETARARASGWRVEVLPGEHLHLVVDPEAVADFVVDAPAG